MKSNIDSYIEKHPQKVQVILQNVRKIIRESAPTAEEGFNYGVPAFKLHGKNLLMYAGFKNHIGIYPDPDVIQEFSKDLKSYKTSKGTIQFQITEPIPYDLISKIVKYKVKRETR